MLKSLMQTIETGGWVMWPIFISSIIVWGSGLWLLFMIIETDGTRKRFFSAWYSISMNNKVPYKSCGNSVGDELLAAYSSRKIGYSVLHSGFTAAFISDTTSIINGLASMKVWISVAPLLGLLGTVAGMIEIFRTITVYGVGNPAFTAGGISIALFTTEAGLAVAVPGMLLHVFIANRKNNLILRLTADAERIGGELFPENEMADLPNG